MAKRPARPAVRERPNTEEGAIVFAEKRARKWIGA
jgi:hypothetical protein